MQSSVKSGKRDKGLEENERKKPDNVCKKRVRNW